MVDATDCLMSFLRSESLLQSASSAAFRDGVVSALFDNEPMPLVDVVAAQLPARRRGGTVTVAIRWTMANPVGDVIPPLDADLQIRPLTNDRCELALSGCYRPPETAGLYARDRGIVDAVANTTCLAFLNYIAPMLEPSAVKPVDIGSRLDDPRAESATMTLGRW